MTFQQQVRVLFFLLEVVRTDKSRLLHLDSVLAAGYGCEHYSIILLMICPHRWFQSDVCELEIYFLSFSFSFRLRLSACQSEHLCKLLVSLTTTHVFKHLLKVPLTAFFGGINVKQSCPIGTMFCYQVLC